MLKINVNNQEKIQAAINEAESKAQVRLLGGIERINKAVEQAEKQLNNLGIKKKYWLDSFIEIQPESVPNSYKYKAEGTYARVRKYSSGWFLEFVRRDYCGKESYGSPQSETLVLSKLAHQHLPIAYNL